MANVALCTILCLLSTVNGFFLRDKESIILTPSAAFRDHSKSPPTDWLMYNKGWYYEEDPLQALIMEKSLEVVVGKDLDRNRVKMFTADGEKNKEVCIDGMNRAMCTTTDDEGRIKNTFKITNAEMNQLVQTSPNSAKVVYKASVPKKSIRVAGEIYLCDDNGMTFISDIDDTIKITGVTSTADTLINTFSGTYKSVSGMASIYQYWQKQYSATFAYITASPDQLYPYLREFFDAEKFPPASFHMRHFTWLAKDFITFFNAADYVQHKTETLEMFMTNTVNRTFILIGDVFQKDPEIYAGIFAKYPNRIGRIFIRKYANDAAGQQRLESVFANISRPKWRTFESGSDLPQDVYAV